MSKDQFEDYCENRGVGYRKALRYYQTCQLRQNRHRVHRLSPQTQRLWWKTRATLIDWLSDFTVGVKTQSVMALGNVTMVVGRVRCEQGMSRVIDGYTGSVISRRHSRKIAANVFSKIQQDILH